MFDLYALFGQSMHLVLFNLKFLDYKFVDEANWDNTRTKFA